MRRPVPGDPLPDAPIGGHCDRRFEGVRGALRTNFREEGEWGCSVCVRVGDRTVVDLWGGYADTEAQHPWQRDTLVNVYSVGKGVLAMLALCAAESGAIALEGTVASVWPEFSACDKGALLVRELLGHRAGLPAVRERLPDEALYDWDRICRALASQAPYWPPGERHGYHVNTHGFLVGEVLRRATGVPVARLLEERLTGPLRADFFFGVPATEHARVARTLVPEVKIEEDHWPRVFPPTGDDARDQMIWHTYFNPSGLSGFGTVNTPAWREAVIPSTNGHATARGVAALYGAYLRGGGGLPGAGLRSEARQTVSDGVDLVLGRPSRFGLGFQLPREDGPFGPSRSAHGHFGYGGSLGLCDPEADLAFAFLTNRPGPRWQTPRTQRLLAAVYAALGG